VNRAVSSLDQFYGRTLGYNYQAMRARVALERGAWTDAAALATTPSETDYVRSLTHFARALGAARSNQAARARADLDSLAAIERRLRDANDAYWATVVGAQLGSAAAWVTLATDPARALAEARAAADLEETVAKHPVTPGPLLPARELLADMLLDQRRAAEAQAEYERTMLNEPRRLRSMFGAARAAERAGDMAAARKHWALLLEVAGKADAGLPEVAAARAFRGP
jgi:predicted Zn-dependent protease